MNNVEQGRIAANDRTQPQAPRRYTRQDFWGGSGGTLCQEASILGFAPGEWPGALVLEDGPVEVRYLADELKSHAGDVAYAIYQPSDKTYPTIHVLND